MNPTSKIVALSSAIAFGLQIALALLMLRYFSPKEVGTFSVISQIGFFWTTLALAQAPLQLLANHGVSVLEDARLAWVASMKRFIWLLPITTLAVWFSGMSFVSTLLWALLLSFCQLTWMLAQSMRLRMASDWAQAGVLILPPLTALLVALAAASMHWNLPSLLVAALLGYAVGAIWLLPAILAFHQDRLINTATEENDFSRPSVLQILSQITTASAPSNDNRSTNLRIGHTLVDALLATSVVVVWQRLYGAQETGWMAATLRVMGFIPAVIHMAWAQVQLAQPRQTSRTSPLWVGLAGFAIVGALGAGCALALGTGWLGKQWQGLLPYLLPLVLWQGSACVVAAFSHLPFQANKADSYSRLCISVSGLQIFVLFVPILTELHISQHMHIVIFSILSSIGFIFISAKIKLTLMNVLLR
jgi:hypothetical protein